MKRVDIDVVGLERQLADLAVPDGEALEVLARLAEVVFPGRTGMGDRARVLWPEPGRRSAAGPDADSTSAAARLQARIRQTDARFRSLVEQLPAVVFHAALDEGDNEVYVSPQIEALLGFTQQEWLTNPLLWYSQLHPDDHETVIDAFTRGVQTGGPFRAEVRFLSRDGNEVWIMGEARLIRDESGRLAYFQGVAFDITTSKRAQEELAQAERTVAEAARIRADAYAASNVELTLLNEQLRTANEQAEAAVRARTTFLTTMSHELRTPLNSVIVLSGLLADGELTPAQRDMVRHMRLASDHLLEVINDILDFSRLRAGHVELDRRTFDLEAWTLDTLDIVAPRATEKGLDLRYRIAADVPRTLTTDEGRLRQVLLNLLGNALKFTSEGYVEVSVTARPVEPVGEGPTGRWEFECSVRDTGIGIKAEAASALFEEFRQADTGVAREFGGTGLGLAICSRLCQLLGGRIWTDGGSRPGSDNPGGAAPGATFTFTWVAEADDGTVPTGDDGPRFARPPADSRRGASAGRLGLGAGDRLRPAGQPEHRSAALPLTAWFETLTNSLTRRLPSRTAVHNGGGNEPPPTRAVSPPGPRILLVEDDPMNQQVALLLLDAMGHHKASVVSNGEEAIAAASGQAYDIVLMDVAMPTTDGLTATRSIRNLGRAIHQPFIIGLTANALPGDADVCIEAGMDDYVAKPIDRAELARALAAGGGAADPRPPDRRTDEFDTGDEQASAEAEAGELDLAVPSRILHEFGAEPLRRLLAIFRSRAPGLSAAASAAVGAGDAETAGRAAHTLKSNAANIGAAGLATACSELETLARSGSLEDAGQLAATIAALLASALEQLEHFEATLPA